MFAKTIFITGATAGFGEAMARNFAATGNRLILTGRRAERLEALRDEFSKETSVHCAVLDVRDAEQVRQVVQDLPAAFAEVDVLINNAGLALGVEKSQAADLEAWRTMVDTNIMGVLHCTHALLPGMVERNRGQIINIGSIAGSYPYAGGNVYGATKAFLAHFSKNLRADLFGTRIRVSNIEPGAVETEFSLVRYAGDRERASQVYQGFETMCASDIARIAAFIIDAPEHVDISRIEVMPTAQAPQGIQIYKGE